MSHSCNDSVLHKTVHWYNGSIHCTKSLECLKSVINCYYFRCYFHYSAASECSLPFLCVSSLFCTAYVDLNPLCNCDEGTLHNKTWIRVSMTSLFHAFAFTGDAGSWTVWILRARPLVHGYYVAIAPIVVLHPLRRVSLEWRTFAISLVGYNSSCPATMFFYCAQ